MKRYMRPLAVIVLFLMANLVTGNVSFAQKGPPKSEGLFLPADTPIRLRSLEEINSQRNRQGDEILFAVAEDVIVSGRVCLVAGTPVLGTVTDQTAARSWGRGGDLNVEVISTLGLYSDAIGLSGEAGGDGDDKGIEVVAVVLVFGLIFGALVSGSKVEIPAGQELFTYSNNEYEINDITEQEMRDIVDEWYTEKVIDCFLNYRWDEKDTIGEVIRSMGYTIDDEDFTITDIGGNFYEIEVALGSGQVARFNTQPFEEPHIGKFKQLEPLNGIAEDIIEATYRT